MRLYYFQDERGNFGDDLNPWFWQKALGSILNDKDEEILLGIGTLINNRNKKLGRKKLVMGSGLGYGDLPEDLENWDFRLVRGPLSAGKLGLSANHWITDPAVMCPIYAPLEGIEKCYPVAFMPHCDSESLGDWHLLCEAAGIHYISPRQDFLKVFREIKQTKLLITEAMHGAILADAYRTPWVAVKCYRHILDFKWLDWMYSMNVNAELHTLPSHYRGWGDMNLVERLKAGLKILLVKAGKDPVSLTMPPRMRSSKATEAEIIQSLKALSTQTGSLSSDELIAAKQQQFQHAFDALKIELTFHAQSFRAT
jgi:hypothetical protein